MCSKGVVNFIEIRLLKIVELRLPIRLPHTHLELSVLKAPKQVLPQRQMMLMMMHTKTVVAVKEHDRTPSSSQSSSRRNSNEGEENVQCTSGEGHKTWLGAPAALSPTFIADVLKTTNSKR